MTYRMLSSVLAVPAHQAKQMLHEFKRQQQRKVHATYVLCGYLQVSAGREMGGLGGHSAAPLLQPASGSAQFVVQCVRYASLWPSSRPQLTRCFHARSEEKLEHAKAAFETLTSQHVYCVQPASPVDLAHVWLAESAKFKALLMEDTPEAQNYLSNRWSAIGADHIERKAFGDGAFRCVLSLCRCPYLFIDAARADPSTCRLRTTRPRPSGPTLSRCVRAASHGALSRVPLTSVRGRIWPRTQMVCWRRSARLALQRTSRTRKRRPSRAQTRSDGVRASQVSAHQTTGLERRRSQEEKGTHVQVCAAV